MSLPPIGTLLPHSAPMLLLDRLLRVDGDFLCAEVRIGAASLFCDGSGVGAWIGIEYMAQAIAAYAGYGAHVRGEAAKPGFLLGTRHFEALRPLFPVGSVLHVHVHRVAQGGNGLAAFECRIDDMSALPAVTVATATVTVFEPDNVNDFLHGSLDGRGNE